MALWGFAVMADGYRLSLRGDTGLVATKTS
jgi:hypothetical protein